MNRDPHHLPAPDHGTYVPDLRPEVYGREMRVLCGAVYVGPDPLGLGLSSCMMVGQHDTHDDGHGRRWAASGRSVTITLRKR